MPDALSLPEIETQLSAAQADHALFQRLTDAAARVKSLTAARDKAAADHAKDEAAKANAADEARFADLRGLRIVEVPNGKVASVMGSRFEISYTRDAYSVDAGATVPTPENKQGFHLLEPRILSWIVQRHPEKIPASITDLAPGNVDAALDRYFIALRRGFLAS